MPKKGHRNALYAIISALGLLLALFLIAEAATRYFRPQIKPNMTPIQRSKKFHHNYLPNCKWYIINDQQDGGETIRLSTDALAMRNSAGSLPLRENSTKILIIGDSYVQADEVPFEQTMGRQLELMLADKDLQVLQHGISSWSPLLSLNWYHKIGRTFKPKVVVLQICVNDFSEAYASSDVSYTRVAQWDEQGLPKAFAVQEYSPNRIKMFLLQHSRFLLAVSQLKQKYLNRRTKTKQLPEEANPHIAEFLLLSAGPEYWSQKIKANVEQSMQYIRKLNQLVVEDGAVLIVIDAPLPWTLNASECKAEKKKFYHLAEDVVWPYGIGRYYKKRFSEMNIKFIDLQQEFAGLQGASLYNNLDAHWSKDGHQQIARILAGVIKAILENGQD